MSDDLDDFLAHYGVKGMKWGVVKKDATSSDPASSKETSKYIAAIPKAPKLSNAQKAKNAAENQAKFLAKAEIDPADTLPDSGKGWHPTGKQVAWGLAGAAFVGLYAYGAYTGRLPRPGSPCTAAQFNAAVSRSKMQTWYKDTYITEQSFARSEFSLPSGHVFNRISTVAEDSFNVAKGTYATHSVEDFNRYVTAFRHEKNSSKGLYHVAFEATSEVKVPNLTTVLGALSDVLTARNGSPPSPEQVLKTYTGMSGGAWIKDDVFPVKKLLFEKLSSYGYHAIVDEMDAGVIGETPLVLFDYSVVGQKTATNLTAEAIKLAEASITELSNRKL